MHYLIATSQGAEGREGPKKEILVWLLSKKVYYKLIPKKSKKFIREFYELGLKRTEAVQNEKNTFGFQPPSRRQVQNLSASNMGYIEQEE